MKKFLNDFKGFAMKGNVIDMAVGIIIGQAFSKIVTSLVQDIIMPIIGVMVGNTVSFANYEFYGIKYGAFLQAVVDFLIIALSIFVFVKLMTQARTRLEKLTQKDKDSQEEEKEETPEPSEEAKLLTEIRDLLKNQE